MSLVDYAPNLASERYGTLQTWFFSPALPSDQRRIGDAIMGYLVEGNVQLCLYSDRDVIVIFQEMIGNDVSKIVHRAISYFQNIACAALIAIYPSDPTCELGREYQLAVQWNDKQGLVGAFGYHEEPGQRKIMISPAYSCNMQKYYSKFFQDREDFECSLNSWRIIARGLLWGITKIHQDGFVVGDLGMHNMLVKCDQEGEVEDCVICDYESIRVINSSNELLSSRNLEKRVDNLKVILQIIHLMGVKSKTISADIQARKPILDSIKTHLGDAIELGPEWEAVQRQLIGNDPL